MHCVPGSVGVTPAWGLVLEEGCAEDKPPPFTKIVKDGAPAHSNWSEGDLGLTRDVGRGTVAFKDWAAIATFD
jgi:hypothetical protein